MNCRSAVLACLTLVACNAPLFSSLPPVKTPNEGTFSPPVLTVDSIGPSPVKAGDEVTIVALSDETLTNCSAALAGIAATCSVVEGKRCECAITIDDNTAEGQVVVAISATGFGGGAAASGTVQVDRKAPTIDTTVLTFARRPIGQTDAVQFPPATLAEPAPVYTAQAIKQLLVWDAAAGGTLIAGVTDPDLTQVVTVEIPSTELLAPPVLWVSAVDVPGNESARIAIVKGADTAGPVPGVAHVGINRVAVGALDSVIGSAGALPSDSGCALSLVQIFDSESAATQLGEAVPNFDGSFAAVSVGTTTSAPRQVFMQGSDKCGNQGPRAEVASGKSNTDPSIVTVGTMSTTHNAVGVVDTLTVATNALVLGECSLLRVDIMETPPIVVASVTTLPITALQLPGSATHGYRNIDLQVFDKCGRQSGVTNSELGIKDGPTVVAPGGTPPRIERNAVGAVDRVEAQSGPFNSSASCPMKSVTVWDASTGGTSLVTIPTTAASGSFAFTNLPGTATTSPPHLYLEANDKCDNPSITRYLITNGSQTTVPVISPGSWSLTRNGAGVADTISIPADGVTLDFCALARLDLFEGSATTATDTSITTLPVVAHAIAGTTTVGLKTLQAQAIDKCGNSSLRLVLTLFDTSPPVPTLAPNTAGFIRNALGTADRVVDPGTAWDTTFSCKITAINIFAAPSGGTSLVTITPTSGTSGAFASTALPGTETTSPASAYTEATDKCGWVSSTRRDILTGKGVNGPPVDESKITITRNAIGVADQAEGATGTSGAGDCATKSFSIVAASTVVATAPAVGSSFAQVTLTGMTGVSAATPQAYFARATDKCGNTGSDVEIQSGKDETAPTVDGTLLHFVGNPAGTPDTLSADAGAVTDTLAVRSVRASDGGTTYYTGNLTLTAGGFAAASLGDLPLQRAYVEAEDKAGNRTNPQVARNGSLTQNLSGRLPGQPNSNPAKAYVYELDGATYATGQSTRDSRFPGLGVALGTEPNSYIGVAGDDSSVLNTVALPSGIATAPQLGLKMTGPGAFAATAWDPVRRVAVSFGGYDQYDATNLEHAVNTTWELDNGVWSRIGGAAPSARYGAGMAYDAQNARMVLYGGVDAAGMRLNDTWAYSANTWSLINDGSSNSPSPRSHFAIAYDGAPSRQRVTMFGGYDNTQACPVGYGAVIGAFGFVCNDTWVLNGSVWTQVVASGLEPPPTHRHKTAMVYDSSRQLLVLYSGEAAVSATPTRLEDLWEFDGDHWTEADATGPGAPAGGRAGHAMAFDDRATPGPIFWIYGGEVGTGSGVPTSDAQFHSFRIGGSWGTPLTQTRAFTGASLVFDTVSAKLIHFGGQQVQKRFVDNVAYQATTDPLSDPQPLTSFAPSSRSGAASAFDQNRGKWVLFGGSQLSTVAAPSNVALNDTWEWDGAAWARVVTPTTPLAAAGAQMVYDARRSRIVMFGGKADSADGQTCTPYCNMTWAYDGSTWTKLRPNGQALPTPRSQVSMAYDSTRDRIVMFGGTNGPTYFSDTWEFDGTVWTSQLTVAKPFARVAAAVAHDAATGETFVVGGALRGGVSASNCANGDGMDGAPSHCADTWGYRPWMATPWNAFTGMATSLPPIAGATLAFDPTREVLLLFGGVQNNGMFPASGGLWEGRRGVVDMWTATGLTSVDVQRALHTADWDSARREMLVHGGEHGAGGGVNNFGDGNRLYSTHSYTTEKTLGGRMAAHLFSFPVPDGATVTSVAPRYVGAADGDDPAPGPVETLIEVSIWDWSLQHWYGFATGTADAATCAGSGSCGPVLQPALPLANPDHYAQYGLVWLRALPWYPNASGASQLATDFVDLQVEYTLP